MMDYNELDMRVAELEDENKRLREALKAIAHPIEHMQKEAEREGFKINGQMAVELAESAAYLKGLAKEALGIR